MNGQIETETSAVRGVVRRGGSIIGSRGLVAAIGVVLFSVVIGLLFPPNASNNGGPNSPAGSTSAINSMPSVPWKDYAPDVKSRIDAAAAGKDCKSLQAEFDNADANNDATMRRTGHNNSELMTYIDASLRQAGCYK